MKWMLKHAGLVAGLVLLVALGLYYAQNWFIYHPAPPGFSQRAEGNQAGYRHPGERGMTYSDVTVIAEDGIKLKGWLMTQSEPYDSPTFIFFHENAGNLGYRLDYFSQLYTKLRVNLIAVSYRGFGASEGSPSEEGIQRDGRAILKYAFDRAPVDRERIYVVGRSLGGAVAIYALAEGKNLRVREI